MTATPCDGEIERARDGDRQRDDEQHPRPAREEPAHDEQQAERAGPDRERGEARVRDRLDRVPQLLARRSRRPPRRRAARAAWSITIPIAKPSTKPAMTALERNVETQPIRSRPSEQVDDAGGERERRRVRRRPTPVPSADAPTSGVIAAALTAQTAALGPWISWRERAEQRVGDQRGERGVEPVLDRDARERRVREALRDEQRPDRQAGDRVADERPPVVARQPVRRPGGSGAGSSTPGSGSAARR